MLKRVRQLHLWLGTFFAPSIIFFALTGALQTFSLHERHPGEAYQPPAWIVKLAQIHKKQNAVVRRGGAPKASPKGEPANAAAVVKQQLPADQPPNAFFVLALKWFVCLTAIGLAATTGLGIIMAFQFGRDKRVLWSLLLIGTLLPCALLLLE